MSLTTCFFFFLGRTVLSFRTVRVTPLRLQYTKRSTHVQQLTVTARGQARLRGEDNILDVNLLQLPLYHHRIGR